MSHGALSIQTKTFDTMTQGPSAMEQDVYATHPRQYVIAKNIHLMDTADSNNDKNF